MRLTDIVDVDFRWVKRNLDPSGFYDEPRIETVLQWRKRLPEYMLNDGWTDWQDVRTEGE